MDIFGLNQYRDPVDWDNLKTNLLFLGHGPWRVIAMVGLYLTFVLKVGPQIMHKKQAFDLRRIVRVYNFFNIIFNIWLAYRGIHLGGDGHSFFNCHCLDRDHKRFSVYIDIFILSRIIDFLDTIFFVLRKKQSQITGLHVFHHSLVPLIIYTTASFSMNPFSGFLIVMNSLVHVVMYSYYFLATFPSVVPYLWWKRYITRIQIGQFCLALAYFSLGYLFLPRFCDNPPMVPVVINLMSATIFLVLFLSFYSGAYKSRSSQRDTTATTNQVQSKGAQHGNTNGHINGGGAKGTTTTTTTTTTTAGAGLGAGSGSNGGSHCSAAADKISQPLRRRQQLQQ